MGYIPITPFRRTVDAGLLERQKHARAELPPGGVNKWEVLRELSAARLTFGLGDRDMAVLQALLSFCPGTILGGNSLDLVVHPSNRSICERLNGMPESTMRRYLSHLVEAGVLVRRDSPNGKRYARQFGEDKEAFGFDLTPLVSRFEEFCRAAEEVRASTEALRRQREKVSLMRRDLVGLAAYGAENRPDLLIWQNHELLADLASKALRRRPDGSTLTELEVLLDAALTESRGALETSLTEEMSTNDTRAEQHYQNSSTDLNDLELRVENAKAGGMALMVTDSAEDAPPALPYAQAQMPNVPLGLVVSTCPEISTYADQRIRHWHDLVRSAEIVRPMMGISPSAWDEAKSILGPEEASVVLAAMLQRFSEIKSAGGYLRTLVGKAAVGAFSSGPMIMALMRRSAA